MNWNSLPLAEYAAAVRVAPNVHWIRRGNDIALCELNCDLALSQGRKLLIFYFGLSVDIIAMLHAAIKSIMPFCEKALLSELGEVGPLFDIQR